MIHAYTIRCTRALCRQHGDLLPPRVRPAAWAHAPACTPTDTLSRGLDDDNGEEILCVDGRQGPTERLALTDREGLEGQRLAAWPIPTAQYLTPKSIFQTHNNTLTMLISCLNMFSHYLFAFSLLSSLSNSVAAHPTLPQFLVRDVDHPPGIYYFSDSFDRVYTTSEYPYYIDAEDLGECKLYRQAHVISLSARTLSVSFTDTLSSAATCGDVSANVCIGTRDVSERSIAWRNRRGRFCCCSRGWKCLPGGQGFVTLRRT
jgi:hypothetical protein